MAHTKVTKTGTQNNGTANTFSYSGSFDVFKASEVEVRLDNVVLTFTTSTINESASPREYTVDYDNKTVHIGGANLVSTDTVIIQPTTDIGSPTARATYEPGSSVSSADLNNNQLQLMRKLMEHEDRKLSNTGGTMTGDLTIGEDRLIRFEGATDDGYETYLTVADPTADRTITFPNVSGNVVTTGDTGTVTSTMLTDGTIVNADVNASAAIDGTKISPVFGGQTIITTGNAAVGGTLAVTGAVDLNGGASIDNIQIGVTGDNEIDTASGNLTIDSAGGTTTIDDALAVTGGVSLDTTLGVTGTSTLADVTGGAVVTSGTSTSDTKVYSAKRAGEIFYGKDTVEEIQSGELWSAADDKVATTAAIDARIIDLVDDVGGFVPIANELSFPNANPDVNNGAGTLVSIKALSTAYTSNSSGEITISNGTVGNSTVTITGAGNTVTYAQTLGIIVETTSTLNTYAFHRQTPDATSTTAVANNATNINKVAAIDSNVTTVAGIDSDVTAVAGKATEVGRLGTAAAVEDMSILGTTDVVADMAILGTTDVVADMAILGTTDVVADMAILGTTDVVADLNTLGTSAIVADMDALADVATEIGRLGTADAVADMNTLGTADVVSDMNDLATSGNITAMNNCSGSIASINTAASNLTSINNFGDTYQVAANDPTTDGGGNSLAEGDLYFNTSADRLKVYNGSSWVNGVEISGSGAVTTGNTWTGDNRYNDGVKALFGTGSDLQIYHNGSNSFIDESSGTGRLIVRSSGLDIKTESSAETMALFNKDGAVELYYDNSKKLETTTNGITMSGHIDLPDQKEVRIGGASLRLRHDGHSIIQNDESGACMFISSHETQFANTGLTEAQAKFFQDGAVELYYDGSKKFETTSSGATITGELETTGLTRAGDITFKRSGNTRLTVDNGGITVGGDIKYNDNYKIKVGTGSDLEIYHSGSHSYIKDAGTGSLLVLSNQFALQNAAGSETLFVANENGSVDLYYDDSKKFETYTYGVKVSGTAKIESGGNFHAFDNVKFIAGTGEDLQIYHDGTDSYIKNTTGDLILRDDIIYLKAVSTTDTYLTATNGGGVELRYDNSTKFETTSSGVKVVNLQMDDSSQAAFGTGEDLKIFHDGTNSHIKSDTNALILRSDALRLNNNGNTETLIKADVNGAAELYWDNSKKLATSASGVEIENGDLRCHLDVKILNDSRAIYFGAGNDLKIYHDGGANYIQGDGHNTYIWSNGAALKAIPDGSVELYYNGSKSLYTSLTGASVKGSNTSSHTELIVYGNEGQDALLMLAADDGDDNADYWRILADASDPGPLWIQNYKSGSWESSISCNGNGNVELYYDASKKLETLSYGVQVTGAITASNNINFGNNTAKFMSGSANQLNMYFDGSQGNIETTTNSTLCFKTNGSERWGIEGGGHFKPHANNTYDLGTSSYRIRNVYTNDLHLSNEGSSNDVDGSWGDWTIQEGESDLFLKNNRSGKKYKFNLTEVS